MSPSLAKQIEDLEFRSILDGLNGTRKATVNPFTREELTFDYSKVHKKYHASQNPHDMLTLYKGALRGYEHAGFLSNALRNSVPDHVKAIKRLIENSSDNVIYELLDKHTSYYTLTALLSATFNPEQAQVFAPTHPLVRKKEYKTIYQLRVKANRCVVDSFDTGCCGNGKELLILGAIFPDEISAVKILNDDEHSELLATWEGANIIRRSPDKSSYNTAVKDPSNWKYF